MTNHTDHASDSSSESQAHQAAGALPSMITPAIAARILETIDHGLSYGLGKPEPGCMCLLGAISFVLGSPHSESPDGVDKAAISVALALNDCGWSSRMMRARGLRRFGLALLDTKDRLDVKGFAARLIRHAFRRVPAAMRTVASIHTDAAFQAALNSAATACEHEPTRESLVRARKIISAAIPEDGGRVPLAVRAVGTCVGEAIGIFDVSNYDAVSLQAANTVVLAIEAEAAAASVLDETVEVSTRDNGLATFAESVVQILIELRAPGCQWLDLAGASMKAVAQREIQKLSQTDRDSAS